MQLHSETGVQPKRRRFFVEAGACDGELISNTLYFEVKHNWTGLLVEPNPDYVALLKKKNRKSWILPHCLSPTKSPTVVDFDAIKEYGGIINSKNGKQRKPGNINMNVSSEWKGPLWRRTLKVYLNCFMSRSDYCLYFENIISTW